MPLETTSQSRDVQDELKNNRRRKRPAYEVPYPVVYSNDQLAHDNWNHMFLKSLSQGLTLRQYATPPTNILDLGCGSGLWVMDAAQQWPSSNFVGYDCLQIQPDLKVIRSSQPGLADLAKRVKWMHGNFLDPLPFDADSFDFVRICDIGLGVPEDEWQCLFQEVSRILKPGAFVEIIEEDLIFPASIDTVKSVGTPSPVNRLKPLLDPHGSEQNGARAAPRASNTSTKSRFASTVANFHREPRIPPPIPDIRISSPFPRPTMSELLDPRDHSRLKAAWDEMLHKRFLAPGLLSVLHFYFSAEFEDAQSHPAVRVVLPSNSRMTFDSSGSSCGRTRSTSVSSKLAVTTPVQDSHMAGSLELCSSCAYSIDGYGPRRQEGAVSGPVLTMSWSAMHLSKVFSTVKGCKEAIWPEYRDLDGPVEDEELTLELRKEFLAAWEHWESDMRDRIGMRAHVENNLAWSIAVLTDAPSWKTWRDRVGYLDGVDDAVPEAGHDICRALRGFVGRKAFHQDANAS